MARRRARKPNLVVIGNGMAGTRTVEELLKIAPDAYNITVAGAEPYGNYNRILGALYEDTRDGGWYFRLMQAGTDISDLREHLIFGPAYAESQPLAAAA